MKSQLDFYNKYLHLLKKYYPSTEQALNPNSQSSDKLSRNHSSILETQWRLPISSMVLELPRELIQQIKAFVKVLYTVSNLKEYRELIQKEDGNLNMSNLDSSSLLMAYDFHWSEEKLHLIEVNTNASGYLISELVHQAHGMQSKAIFYLKNSFQAEWQKWQQSFSPKHLCLVDQEVKKQKMLVEFLMFKDLLATWGWSCQIKDIQELQLNKNGEIVDLDSKKVDMIYNRLTDFYLDHSPVLRHAFLHRTCHISPGPLSYYLLADKSRLCHLSSESFLKELSISQKEKHLIQEIIPKTDFVKNVDAEKLWANRKQFFFKPLRGYGGKAVYRGKNITRSKFKEILQGNGIYQEAVSPGSGTDSTGTNWKYDIRAYVYQDQLQHLTARVYQGQVTGFDREGAGFASILVR